MLLPCEARQIIANFSIGDDVARTICTLEMTGISGGQDFVSPSGLKPRFRMQKANIRFSRDSRRRAQSRYSGEGVN